MRKESATVQKCKRQMATLGFDSQLAYHRVKLILKIYRDVVWVLSERMEELHEYAWELGAQDVDTGLTVRLLTRWPGKVCAIINILPSGTNTWSSGFWRMNGISGWMAIPSW